MYFLTNIEVFPYIRYMMRRATNVFQAISNALTQCPKSYLLAQLEEQKRCLCRRPLCNCPSPSSTLLCNISLLSGWCNIAHLSRPWSNGWVALSFLIVRSSRHGDISSSSTSTCPRPPNPYIFWKLMIVAIQKWIRNTNTNTKTNTKTMTKTKTPRK